MRNVVFALDASAEAARRRLRTSDSVSLTGATLWDESGGGRHFTAASTVTLVHNGTRWVYRFGGGYLQSAAAVDLSSLGQRVRLGVSIRATGVSTYGFIAEHGPQYDADTDRFALYFDTSYLAVAALQGDVGVSGFQNSLAVNTAMRNVVATFDKSLASGETALSVDRSAAGVQSPNSNNTNGFGSETFYIGRRTTGDTYYLTGDIARLVLCHDSAGDWSSADDDLLDAWLAGRTGIIGPVEVNGIDIRRTLGYPITALDNWAGRPRRSFPSAALPGQTRRLSDRTNGTVDARTIRLEMVLKPTDMSSRTAALQYLASLFTGDVELRFGDAPWKAITGARASDTVAGISPTTPFAIEHLRYGVEIVCDEDPMKYDVTETALAFSTNTQVPVGDADHGGVIRITGAATNPTVTYKDAAGNTIQTLGLTISIAGGDWVEIDLDDLTITKSVSGVTSSAVDTWTSGNFFRIDPDHASGTTNPSLSVSSGTATLTYRRRWEN